MISKRNGLPVVLTIAPLIIGIFLLSPFFTAAFLTALATLRLANANKLSTLAILSIATLLGLLNATKVPASDMVAYLEWVNIAYENDFHTYFQSTGFIFDPFFFIFNFVLSHLVNGSEFFYTAVFTFIIYSIMLLSINVLITGAGLKRDIAFLVIVTLAFFPPLFNISFHLNRQFLAICLVLLFVVLTLMSRKFALAPLVLAAATHSSAILIFLLWVAVSILPRHYSLSRKFVFSSLLLSTIFFGRGYVATWVPSTGVSLLDIVSARIGQAQYYELAKPNFLVFAVLIAAALYMFKSKKSPAEYKNPRQVSDLIVIFLTLCTFLGLTSISSTTVELYSRFSLYGYSFVPLFLLRMMHFNFGKVQLITAAFLVFCWFFYSIDSGSVWIYQNYESVILFPWRFFG